tara:strand:- start:45 stop:737 length:693 start_codon:yes stop_codon:yes gene_type:complete
MKAIILAGGLGTRLRPLTDKTPKPLLPIKGKPTMQYSIENLVEHGITEIILAISFQADKIKEYFGDGSDFGAVLSYSIETEPLGTGGAVKQAVQNIDDDFVLIWGDNLMDVDIQKMIEQHQQHSGLITMALTPREDVQNFGVAKLENDKIVGFVEKPSKQQAPTNLINAGAFVINPQALEILPTGVSSIEKDCFTKLAEQGKIFAYQHTGQWFPTDTIEKYQLADKNFNN